MSFSILIQTESGLSIDFGGINYFEPSTAFRFFTGLENTTDFDGMKLSETKDMFQKALQESKPYRATIPWEIRESMELLFYRMLDAIEQSPNARWEIF